MILHIETGRKNEILRKKSKNVDVVSKKILKLIRDMEETMKTAKGVGLAAPQVGVNERVILVTLNGKNIIPMINPEIIDHSDTICIGEEGCLSLPGIWEQVERYDAVTVRFMDLKGVKKALKLEGMNARIVQHEADHLNGVLFTDYLNPIMNYELQITNEA